MEVRVVSRGLRAAAGEAALQLQAVKVHPSSAFSKQQAQTFRPTCEAVMPSTMQLPMAARQAAGSRVELQCRSL